MTWTGAVTCWVQACEADRAHLIVLDDIAEHFVLHDLLGNAGVATSWIAFSDRRVRSAFTWVTSAGLDPASNTCDWGAAGPDARGNPAIGDCVIQAATNQCPDWSVFDCGRAVSYVCEYDGVPADPTRY